MRVPSLIALVVMFLPGLWSVGTGAGTARLADALQVLEIPTSGASAQPHLAAHGDTLVLSWLESGSDGTSALRQAVWSPQGWRERPQVASGERWFVNWADFPSVVPLGDSLWAAHWLRRRPGGPYSYDVYLSLSRDAGTSWSAPFLAHTDGTATEHGFVSLFPWDGAVGALWLDGRNTGGQHDHDHGGSAEGAGMTLRAGRFAANGERLGDVEVDGLVCDCCQTDVAIASSGPVVTYRNRTLQDVRDIHVARLVEGRWEQAGPVRSRPWQIRGCPVNGAAIDADGDQVVVAWYSGAQDQPRVELAWSSDAGASFGSVIVVDEAAPLGRVDVSLLGQGRGALVSWLRRAGAGERGEISLRHVDSQGRAGPILPLIQTLVGRPSGFPQLALQQDQVVLAWTDVDADRVRSARIPLGALLQAEELP